MKKVIVIIGLLIACSMGYAQMPNVSMVSGAQKFVEDAVKNGLLIVNQKYCLVDDNMRQFGSENRDFFGQTISVGIKVNNGYLVDLKAVAPQKFDPNFEAYADRYSAKIKKTEYCMIGDSLLKPLPYSVCEIDTLVADKLFFSKNNVFGNNGFVVDNSNGEKVGWIVWVLSDGSNYSVQLIRKNIRFMDGTTEYNVEKLNVFDNKTIVGGVFVVPQNTAIGQVTFKLAGVVGKIGEQWIVMKMPANSCLSGGMQGAASTDAISPIDTNPDLNIIESNDND